MSIYSYYFVCLHIQLDRNLLLGRSVIRTQLRIPVYHFLSANMQVSHHYIKLIMCVVLLTTLYRLLFCGISAHRIILCILFIQ